MNRYKVGTVEYIFIGDYCVRVENSSVTVYEEGIGERND